MQEYIQQINELQQQLDGLIKQHQELIQANRKYEEVFSLITHEFKNLLTSADGYNRLLHQHLIDENRQDLDEILTASIRIHEKLFRIVDQLLKMWMVEKQLLKPNYKLLEFKTDLLLPLENQLTVQLQTKKMTLQKTLPAGKVILMADENMLEIVMRNLLENAIQYGIPETTIYLSLHQGAQDIKVAAKNKTKDLPADFCTSVFQRGKQFSNRSKAGGLGIGLLNVKNLIDLHGGTIDCRMVDRDWIEFSFTLPLHL